MHGREEPHQRAGPLGEDEAEQPLVARQLAAAADHVPDVLLGQLVVGQIDGREAVRSKLRAMLGASSRRGDRDADEDVRDLRRREIR